MRPTLEAGDVVLVAKPGRLVVGDIVLAAHPYKSSVTVVKRIAAIDDGRVELRGDDPAESTDSRTFGTLAIEDIDGKAECRLARREKP